MSCEQVTFPKLKLHTWASHKMAYWMTIILTLRLAIFPITTCAIHNVTFIEGPDFPHVYVTSLQNNSSNCLINSNDSGRTIMIQSEELSSCSFQLLASYNVTTTLEVVSKSNSSLYAELDELCYCTRRFVLLTGQNNACTVFLQNTNTLLNLQGYIKLSVTVQPLNSSIFCYQSSSGYDSGSNSCSIKEYNDTVTCSQENGEKYLKNKWLNPLKITEVCSVRFQTKCNSFIGYREYGTGCDNILNINKVLIFYPPNMKVLELISNNITQVSETAFRGLYKLKGIFLSKNKIKMLRNNLFKDLLHLLHLDLSHNRLNSLKHAVFNGLGELTHLRIEFNQLTYLGENVFKELSNLTYLYLNHNFLTYVTLEMLNIPQLYVLRLESNPLNLKDGVFSNLNKLEFLSLWNTTQQLSVNMFAGLQNLQHLHLDWNNLDRINAEYFRDLKNMISLHLSRCQITTLEGYLFRYLTKLELLSMQRNEITTLRSGAFRGLKRLLLLRIYSNRLKHIEFGVFKDTPKLIFIDISSNELTKLPNMHLLLYLSFLNLKQNPLTEMTKESLSVFVGNTYIYVSQQEICECFVPATLNCSAAEERSPYLTCDRLLSNRGLAVVMWTIGINALLGNLFVLVFKHKLSTRVIKVQDRFLSNLALSDLLMGIYMIILASADIYFGKYFPMLADQWRSGITCRVTGAIAIISSEASVFFVTLISIDRFVNIRFPFSKFKFKRQSAMIAIFSAWLLAFILGVIPSAFAGRNFRFYDNSHVCVGLPLTLRQIFESTKSEGVRRIEDYKFYQNTFTSVERGYSNGKYFSTAVFLGLNCVCYLIIFCCYIEILRSVRRSSKRSGRTQEVRKQIKLTIRVAAIVATDFWCWSPIIVLGILVQTRVITLSPAAFAWLVSFVLPINSAINPYLYTIANAVTNYRKSKSEAQNQVP